MQFLLWDAQRRAGITDEQITQAMIEKLAVNKLREWPDPKDGEPRFHIKEQPAPVTQQEPIAWLNDAYLARGVVDGEAGSEDAGPGYIPVYREPAAQPAPVVPDDYQHLKNVQELYHGQEKRLFKIAQRIKGPAFDKYSHSPSQAIDVLEAAIFGEDEDCRAAIAAASQEVKGE